MDLLLTAHEQAFYEEARTWLSANVPDGPHSPPGTAEAVARSRAWDRKLFDAGYSVLTWPRKYGGRDATPIQWLLFEDAYHELDAPYRLSQNGITLLAPAVLRYGTDRQRDEILLPMAKGEVIWAQAWSEPGAGSDLASLTSRARPVPNGWRINGQKIWSSHAPSADMAFGLFRTGEPGERHRNLTYLLVPLNAPGVTIRPIRRYDGEASFAEIWFDDVFVPHDAVLGEVGQGWEVAMATSTSERGFALRSPGRFTSAARRLLEIVQPSMTQTYPDLVERALNVWMDARAYRLRVLASVGRAVRGEAPGLESSVDKLFWSELDTRLYELALDILQVLPPDYDHRERRRWLEGYVTALPGTIWGGTSEIQRNIVALRALGLPRSY